MATVDKARVSGTLVAHGVPQGTTFGVDWRVHTVGPEFLGMKLIPPGLHLAIYGSEIHSLGFFFRVAPGDVLTYRWDAATECLVAEEDEETRERTAAQVRAFHLDNRLGAYDPADPAADARDGTWAIWSSLASRIDERVLARAGIPIGATVAPDGFADDTIPAQPPAAPPSAEPLPLHPAFTPLRATRPAVRLAGEACMPEAVTAFNFDGSARLEELLRTAYACGGRSEPWALLLGELQLSFVLMLQVHSHGALVFWKQALALLCGCERALAEPARGALFEAFVRVLRAQLAHLPADLFIDELSGHNFLAPALAGLRELMADAPAGVQRAAGPLWEVVAERFGLDAQALAEIGDEDAPVVVWAREESWP